jgi:hypothetical protein
MTTTPTTTTPLRQPISADQLRSQYARNAAQLADMVDAARISTDSGKGGPKGRRYRGYYFHQLVALQERAATASLQTDADLAPMLDAVNRILGGR